MTATRGIGHPLKRPFDILVSAGVLVAASPLLLGSMFAVWLQDRQSPFYMAPRVARGGGMFTMIKIRSMIVDAAKSGVNSTGANDKRVTGVGRFIRRYKIDELSQFINVMAGSMSVVGPRPNTRSWGTDLYTDEEMRLLDVRPGVTDLASIVFSDEGDILAGAEHADLRYNELIRPWKSRLSLFYIEHMSVGLDLQICWLTALALLDKRRALDGVVSVLEKRGADPDLVETARRTTPLRAFPPPGASEVETGAPRVRGAPTEARRPIRVAHVTTVHAPFDVRIFHKQCVTLADAGYQVTLIQRGDKRETVKGVDIEPLPTYSGRLSRMTFGVWTASRLAFRTRADVIHFHDAEFIWGALILKAFGRQVVYDVHEDLPKDLEDKAYLPRWSIPPLQAAMTLVEWIAKRAFDRISTATQSISERFRSPRTQLIRNTPILGELTVSGETPFVTRPPNVAYLGGLAPFNGPEQMVAAMEHVPDDIGARLILGGKFTDARVEACVRAADGWSKVEYVGWVDRSQIGALLSQVRCGLVVYQPTPNVVDSEPNKFFEILSAGLPLVASDFPVWRAFIERYRCGLVVNPADPQSIGEAITYLLRNPDEAEAMGARGRAAVLGSYNWGQDGAKLVEMYEGLGRARHHSPSMTAIPAAG